MSPCVFVLDAKTNIRDYHGKMAAHYWTGPAHVFERPDLSGEDHGLGCFLSSCPKSHDQSGVCSPGGKTSRGKSGQRHVLPSLRLSKSRSHGHLSLDFGSRSAGGDTWDLQV